MDKKDKVIYLKDHLIDEQLSWGAYGLFCYFRDFGSQRKSELLKVWPVKSDLEVALRELKSKGYMEF